MTHISNPLKADLRKRIKSVLTTLSSESIAQQSQVITKKILASNAFKKSQRISVYLSTTNEVSTLELISEMFRQKKDVFVPSYHGNVMEMIKLHSMDDFNTLPLTKWNIKQPKIDSTRENALENGGLDLFIMPGVAFSLLGGRLGHGMGYYDKYIRRHFDQYPEKHGPNMSITEKCNNGKTILLGLAFQEQIVEEENLVLEPHDFILDCIVNPSTEFI